MSAVPRGVGLIALVGLLGLTAAALAPAPRASPSTAKLEPLAAPAAPPLPALDATLGSSLLARSPFAHDRSAFTRNIMPQTALEIRLAGISKVGGKRHAQLVIGNQTVSVAEGDATPSGPVKSIEADAVVLAGPPERRLELFKQ